MQPGRARVRRGRAARRGDLAADPVDEPPDQEDRPAGRRQPPDRAGRRPSTTRERPGLSGPLSPTAARADVACDVVTGAGATPFAASRRPSAPSRRRRGVTARRGTRGPARPASARRGGSPGRRCSPATAANATARGARCPPRRPPTGPSVLGEVPDRADQPGLAVGAGQRLHELLGQLEPVDRQHLQVGQRRVAGAEVVDVEVHAERGQSVEPLDDDAVAGQQDALGDLEDDRRRVDAAGPDRVADVVDDARVLQLAAADVHRDVQRLVAGRGRCCQRTASRSAVCRTIRPSGTISPVSSARRDELAGQRACRGRGAPSAPAPRGR